MNTNEHALAAYSMVLLHRDGQYLLLKRSGERRFAPGRWTGIGGRVEPGELERLETAAFREIEEETEITRGQIASFCLRRALIQMRPGHPLTVLLYFTGEAQVPGSRVSPEGELHWLRAEDLARLDIIENTASVIPHLIEDIENDPLGQRPIAVGAASFDDQSTLLGIVWSTVN